MMLSHRAGRSSSRQLKRQVRRNSLITKQVHPLEALMRTSLSTLKVILFLIYNIEEAGSIKIKAMNIIFVLDSYN
jgi:hypothetical protein